MAEPKPTEEARTDPEQTTIDADADREVLNRQREHWTGTFDGRTDRFGADPSEPARRCRQSQGRRPERSESLPTELNR